MNIQRLKAIIRKEFIQIFRDKPSLGIALGLPIFMIFLFGYAVRSDVDHVPTAVLDMDKSLESRDFLASFTNSGYFDLDFYVQSRQEFEGLILSNKAKVAIVIPHGFQRDIISGKGTVVQVIVDGSDPMVSRTALSNSVLLAQEKAASIRAAELLRSGGPSMDPLIEARPRVWFNPAMDSVKYNIPGLIGLIMQNVTIMLTAFAMVRERERGTMEQLIVTPIRPGELVLGKLIPYVAIAFVSVAIVIVIGVFWFKMEITGSFLLLCLTTFIFLLAALGMGLFISVVAKTQLQAMQMSFAVILPSVLLSGFMFPRAAMPLAVQFLGYLLPLTYFLDILRGIILKGTGLHFVWPSAALLCFFGLGILLLATKKFHKNLD